MTQMRSFLRHAGLILFFGLCIIILSGVVKVSAGENDIKLNVSDVSITKDGSYRLKVYNLDPEQTVVYRSGNSSIAMVSRTGKVTGLSYGETVITATVIEEGAAVATLQCNVIIGPAAVSIKLTKTNLVLREGKQKLLNTVILPLNTVETPIFYSTDSEIAKVSSAGRVRAVRAGSTQIYAFLENGQSAVCNVTVLNKEDYEKYREGMSVEDILAEEFPEGHAGYHLGNGCGYIQALTVVEVLPCLEGSRNRRRRFGELLKGIPALLLQFIRKLRYLLAVGIIAVPVHRDARGHVEGVADRDHVLRRLDRYISQWRILVNLAVLKFRYKHAHRIGEKELAFLEELHAGSARDRLGHGCQLADGLPVKGSLSALARESDEPVIHEVRALEDSETCPGRSRFCSRWKHSDRGSASALNGKPEHAGAVPRSADGPGPEPPF